MRGVWKSIVKGKRHNNKKQCSEILAAPVASLTALIKKTPQQVANRNSASCQNNMFTNTSSPKFVDFGNARFENCNFAFTYNTTKKSDDWSLTLACACSVDYIFIFFNLCCLIYFHPMGSWWSRKQYYNNVFFYAGQRGNYLCTQQCFLICQSIWPADMSYYMTWYLILMDL